MSKDKKKHDPGFRYVVMDDVGLPSGYTGTSPVMGSEDMERRLNELLERGLELVTYGEKEWLGERGFTQRWWIFKKATG